MFLKVESWASQSWDHSFSIPSLYCSGQNDKDLWGHQVLFWNRYHIFFTDSRCPINVRTGFTLIYNFVQYAGIFAKSVWENQLAVFPGFKSRCEIDLMFTGWWVPNPGSRMTMVCHWASCAKNPCKRRLWISSASANSYLYILPILLNFLVQMAALSVVSVYLTELHCILFL